LADERRVGSAQSPGVGSRRGIKARQKNRPAEKKKNYIAASPPRTAERHLLALKTYNAAGSIPEILIKCFCNPAFNEVFP